MKEAGKEILDFVEEQHGNVLVLRVKGRLDALSASAAEKKIFDFIERTEYKILIDMAGVSYLSSAGMRVLLSATKRLRELSGQLYLSNVSVNVLDVLKMSGFDHVLNIFPTEQDAFRRF